MKSQETWTRIFGRGLRETLEKLPLDFRDLKEIRVRSGQPLYLWYQNREYTVGEDGRMEPSRFPGQAFPAEREKGPGGERERREFSRRTVTEQELMETVECMGNYSLYAFEDEIRQGFLTVRGGHRIGLAGKAVTEGQSIKTIRNISALNVRFAHQVRGCGEPVLPRLIKEGKLCHTLLISPPGGGKTTLLRDLVRLLSDGYGGRPGVSTAVVDERSEIAACYQGVPQNDLGSRTDVLDGCPKALGLMMVIRTMTPAVAAVDEIGGREDLQAVEYAAGCGCSVLATVHGSSLEDVRRKPAFRELLDEGIFERFVVLGTIEKAGTVKAVLDEKGNEVAI